MLSASHSQIPDDKTDLDHRHVCLGAGRLDLVQGIEDVWLVEAIGVVGVLVKPALLDLSLPTVLAGQHAPGQRVVGHETDVVAAEDRQQLALHPPVDGVVQALVDLGQRVRTVFADLVRNM